MKMKMKETEERKRKLPAWLWACLNRQLGHIQRASNKIPNRDSLATSQDQTSRDF
jgi:hypothetical protein